jgi:hypothetical protein
MPHSPSAKVRGISKESSSKSSFKEYIDNGRLILLNYAITNESDKDINFFISQNTLWNSTNGAVASRQGNKTLKKKVRSKRLDDLFREYGMPFYCKIDTFLLIQFL